MHTLWQDVRHGLRTLGRSPGFALVAVLSLALGIGANSALFHLLDAVRLRSLPVKNPQELMEVGVDTHNTGRNGDFPNRYPRMTNPLWEQIRDRQQAFSQAFAWGDTQFDMSAGGEAHDIEGLWVSGDYFRALGVRPVAGRVFAAQDDQRGCAAPGVVLSYGFWQRQFGGNRAAVGSLLTLNGHGFEVLGVTERQFTGMDVGHSFDAALPICAEPLIAGADSRLDSRWTWMLSVFGRLKPGISIAQATAQLNAVAPGIFESTVAPELAPQDAKHYAKFGFVLTPASNGVSQLRREAETPLWLLIGIAGVVLLIACGNLANLLLARATAREREMAVRLAIGASRWRLMRQLLAESLLLAMAGAGLGIVLAGNLSGLLVSFLTTAQDAVFVDLRLDWRVLAFTSLLGVLTSVIFGLAPALRGARVAPSAAIKAGGRGMAGQREGYRLQRALVAGQVALTMVLLFAALLFVRTFRNLAHQKTGFHDAGVLEADLDVRRAGFPKERLASLRQELLERLAATPGVEAAAEAEEYPMSGNWNNNMVRTDVNGTDPKGWKTTNFTTISPGYFRTLGTPIVAGRGFTESDSAGSPQVAVVTESFVRKILGGGNPIGKIFAVLGPRNRPHRVYEIVGVAGDVKVENLREAYRPLVYLAVAQYPADYDSLTFLMRSRLPAADVRAAVTRAVGETSPAISIRFSKLATKISDSLLEERLMATLSGFFGALATLLAIIGLYGVISYTTARRRNEIGIRMALGAERRDVIRMVLRQGGTVVGIGLAAGTVLALVAARAAKALLYGLQPGDPETLLLSLGLLAAVGLIAGYIPARRASRVDPMVALRED